MISRCGVLTLVLVATVAASQKSSFRLSCEGDSLRKSSAPNLTSGDIEHIRIDYLINARRKTIDVSAGTGSVPLCSGDCLVRFNESEIFVVRTRQRTVSDSWDQLVWRYHRKSRFLLSLSVEGPSFIENHLKCRETPK